MQAETKETTRERFDRHVRELGGEPAYATWLGTKAKHKVICAKGHACTPRPNDVQQGKRFCMDCYKELRVKDFPQGPVKGTRWTVVSKSSLRYVRGQNKLFISVVCSCGKGPVWIDASSVRNGKSNSCGCNPAGTKQTTRWKKYLNDARLVKFVEVCGVRM